MEYGLSIAQTLSHRLLTMEARFESQSSQCSIFDGQSSTWVSSITLGGRTALYRPQSHKDTVLSQRKVTKNVMKYKSELVSS